MSEKSKFEVGDLVFWEPMPTLKGVVIGEGKQCARDPEITWQPVCWTHGHPAGTVHVMPNAAHLALIGRAPKS